MRHRILITVAVCTTLVGAGGANAVAAEGPANGTGHPVGGCPVNGGWVLSAADYTRTPHYLVDYVYGNRDGYLCAKDPGDPPGNNFIIDNVVTGQGAG